MGELIDLNPKSANSINTIPDEIARDAEYIAADAAHVAALHPSRVFGFGEGISTENVFDYGSGFLDCRGGGGAFPPGTNQIQGFQARLNYMGSRWGMQLATQYHLNADCFFRTVSDDIWGPWRRIWNDGNFNPSNYLLISEGDSRYRQSAVALTDADIPAAIARDSEVTAAITAHATALDPHPTYLTQSEGDGRYLQSSIETAWTPEIKGGTTAGTVGYYAHRMGISATIGNLVFIQCAVNWTEATGTGDIMITGLPVVPRSVNSAGIMAITANGIIPPAGYYLQNARVIPVGDGHINIQQVNAVGNTAFAQLSGGTMGVSFSGFYFK